MLYLSYKVSKITRTKEALDTIDEIEIISVLKQIAQNGKNESARVTAATRLLDYIKDSNQGNRAGDIYENLTSDIIDGTENNQVD